MATIILLIIITLLFSVVITYNAHSKSPEKHSYTTEELIRAAGYPYKQYQVITTDGYILNLGNIPRRVGSMGTVVLLMHFMTGTSDGWLLRGPKKDLSYMLHDAGYDVWMGDYRGNFYSRKHTFLSPKDPKFWNFSFHEIGKYDNVAFIDYVLQKTGYEQLICAGHSMGTTSIFVTLHEHPEYSKKISLFIGLAPAALTDPTQQSAGKVALLRTVEKIVKIWKSRNHLELLPRGRFLPITVAKALCSVHPTVQAICFDIGFFWVGHNSQLITKSTFQNLLNHAPAGTSINVALQYLQNFRSGKFQQLDLGYEENMRMYGSESPPMYDLTRVAVPVAMYYSRNDYVSNVSDVELTMSFLPSVVHKKLVDNYTHADFMWAKTATNLIFEDILHLLERRNLHRIRADG